MLSLSWCFSADRFHSRRELFPLSQWLKLPLCGWSCATTPLCDQVPWRYFVAFFFRRFPPGEAGNGRLEWMKPEKPPQERSGFFKKNEHERTDLPLLRRRSRPCLPSQLRPPDDKVFLPVFNPCFSLPLFAVFREIFGSPAAIRSSAR